MTAVRQRRALGAGVAVVIRQHGEETYPHECCGALVGSGDTISHAVPLPNVTDEGPRRRFRVSDQDYLAAEKQARALGGDLLGFYHSDPDHPARPSQYDLDHAWPNFAYIIVAVAEGTARDMTVWFLKEDRTSFDEGDLHGDENPDSHTAPAVHR